MYYNIKTKCPQCSNEIPATISAGKGRNRAGLSTIGYMVSYQCDRCGDGIEADGRGSFPPPFREDLIHALGAFILTVDDNIDKKQLDAQIIQRIETRFGLPLLYWKQLEELSRAGDYLWAGLRYEMEWLGELLAELGVENRALSIVNYLRS